MKVSCTVLYVLKHLQGNPQQDDGGTEEQQEMPVRQTFPDQKTLQNGPHL